MRVVSRSAVVMTEVERLLHVGLMCYHETNKIFFSKLFVNFIPLCSTRDANLGKGAGTALDENRFLVSTS